MRCPLALPDKSVLEILHTVAFGTARLLLVVRDRAGSRLPGKAPVKSSHHSRG